MKLFSNKSVKAANPADAHNGRNALRVLYFGTYREEYSRNKIMIDGLRQNGVDVIECHETLWRGIEDRVHLASGGWRRPEFWWRTIRVYFQLLRKYYSSGDYDVMVIGYPGQVDVFLGWMLTRIPRRPLCWDVLMSIYLNAVERKLDRFSPFTVQMLRWIERLASRLPDHMIMDTPEYVNWFCKTHQLSQERFSPVPLGAIFDTIPQGSGDKDPGIFQVVYFGSFIPNHGVDKIIGAARELAGDKTIHFEMIGTGPNLDRAKELAADLENITFQGWVDQDGFCKHLGNADLVLGIFGNTQVSSITIQNKIFECLAMGKPLITGEYDLIRRTFEHEKHMFICERTPQSLAEGIRTLQGNPELLERIGREGHAYFNECFEVKPIGKVFLDCLEKLTQKQVAG